MENENVQLNQIENIFVAPIVHYWCNIGAIINQGNQGL